MIMELRMGLAVLANAQRRVIECWSMKCGTRSIRSSDIPIPAERIESVKFVFQLPAILRDSEN